MKIVRIQALEADQHPLAAAAHQEVEELLVMGGVDARLADPAHAQRDEGPEELFGLCQIRCDVVVHEEDQPVATPDRRHLRQDLVDGTARLRGAEDRLHGAELAAEMTAAPRLDEADGQIALAAEDRASRPGPGERRAALLTVEPLRAAVSVVVDHERPESRRLTR